MKIIGTKAHGYLDYIMGLLLIVSPWLFGFYRGGAETWVPVVLGSATIIYSLLTDYELGLARVIPMKMHLILDGLSGMLLAASPWLFSFSEFVWQPHFILGIAELGAVMLTRSAPGSGRVPIHKQPVH
ncbi:SPW repeat domain-containing protein [Chitinophaga sp. 22620]|uniref:SPW repeat domain-containing protein n=1 Tax=Chitinophaga sp. 22620 TaxID=3453952 RepID=UPI003F841178